MQRLRPTFILNPQSWARKWDDELKQPKWVSSAEWLGSALETGLRSSECSRCSSVLKGASWISFSIQYPSAHRERTTQNKQQSVCWRPQAEWSYSKVALHMFPLCTCSLLSRTCFMISGCRLHWPVMLCSYYRSMKLHSDTRQHRF